jgi:hypothetical protein
MSSPSTLQRLRRFRVLIAIGVALAVAATVVPWLLTRNALAAGWTRAKVDSALAACDTARYPSAAGAVSQGACRCVISEVSHSVPLGLLSAGAGGSGGQAEVERDTAACNRVHPAR